jgi:hypothetical protein
MMALAVPADVDLRSLGIRDGDTLAVIATDGLIKVYRKGPHCEVGAGGLSVPPTPGLRWEHRSDAPIQEAPHELIEFLEYFARR